MLARGWRWFQEQCAFLLVIAILLSAFFYLLADNTQWRAATAILSAAPLVAALFRLTLPSARVGQLAVRGRVFDVVCYLVAGVAMLAVDIRLHT